MESVPAPGDVFKANGFTIQVIDPWNDPRNKTKQGGYKREPDETSVIYEYKTGPIGKIGRCKTLKGFNTCWRR